MNSLARSVERWSASMMFRPPSAVSCNYSASGHQLSVSATDDFTKVARAADEIQIDDGHQLVPCSGGAPTILKTTSCRSTTLVRAPPPSTSGEPVIPYPALDQEHGYIYPDLTSGCAPAKRSCRPSTRDSALWASTRT